MVDFRTEELNAIDRAARAEERERCAGICGSLARLRKEEAMAEQDPFESCQLLSSARDLLIAELRILGEGVDPQESTSKSR